MSRTRAAMIRTASSGASPRLRRSLTSAVLTAMLLGTLLTIAEGQASGWDPGHGHIYRDGIVVAYAHPWDAGARSARLACALPAAGDDVVFTPSADAIAGASIASPLLSGEAPRPCTPTLTLQPTAATMPATRSAAFAAVPTPPPRG